MSHADFSDAVRQLDCSTSIMKQPRFWPRRRNVVYIGAPPDKNSKRKEIKSWPSRIHKICFYLGDQSIEIIERFLNSPYAATVEELYIGISTYAEGGGCDYVAIAEMLSDYHLPCLKSFDFGGHELFCNTNPIAGRLGNVTRFLATHSGTLETIELSGQLEIDHPISFPRLKSLSIWSAAFWDWYEFGPSDSRLLSTVLDAQFPRLEELCIDVLFEEEDLKYEFGNIEFSQSQYPRLMQIDLCGKFTDESVSAFSKSVLLERSGLRYAVGGDDDTGYTTVE